MSAELTLRLHSELYVESAVREAAETFADFADFAFGNDAQHHIVEVSNIDADTDGDVAAEFCNFALANSALLRKNQRA